MPDPSDPGPLLRANLCTHARLHITYSEQRERLKLYCPACDTLLYYTADELRLWFAGRLQRQLIEEG